MLAEEPEVTSAQPTTVVSVLTCAPGSEIYQLEGHTALRLRRIDADGSPQSDLVVNWGVFDFNSPNFVGRFVKGDTYYMAMAYPTVFLLEECRNEGRRVTEQVIDLTPEQTDSLLEAVVINLQPQNREYHYNYVLDNCATRPLELIARSAGPMADGAFGNRTQTDGATFRNEMRRYHSNYPWYQFGIDLALGSLIDRPITEYQRNFAPVWLKNTLAQAKRPDGTPLVSHTQVLIDGPESGTASGPTPWLLTPMAVALLVLMVTIVVSIRDLRRRHISRWLDTALFGVFGLLGLLLTFLIFVSTHYAASPNWLYLWLNPLCFIAAVGVWIKSWRRVVYCWQICNFVAVVLLLVAFAAGMQSLNAAFLPLMLCDLIRSAVFVVVYKHRK